MSVVDCGVMDSNAGELPGQSRPSRALIAKTRRRSCTDVSLQRVIGETCPDWRVNTALHAEPTGRLEALMDLSDRLGARVPSEVSPEEPTRSSCCVKGRRLASFVLSDLLPQNSEAILGAPTSASSHL